MKTHASISNGNQKEVIIALDFPSYERVFDFLSLIDGTPYVKVGMELFYSCGQSVVRALIDRGHKVFLDLKLHDIPNTVSSTIKVLSLLGVTMCNVHCAGGIDMMSEARSASRDMRILGVTQLTSTSQQMLCEQLLVNAPMEHTVIHYASLAQKAGLDGVVCSPMEAGQVKAHCGKDFLTVTPGIRMADSADDQVRIATPAFASISSDYIVVGRPITRAQDPNDAYKRVCKEFYSE